MDWDRPKSNPRSIWWREVLSYWPVYVAGLLAMFLTNGTEVLAPKALQWIIDALFSAANLHANESKESAFSAVLQAAAIFAVIGILGLGGRVFWRFTLARMTHVAGNSMKRGIWDSIRSSPLESVNQYTLGDLMNRAIGDVNSARWIYGFTLVLTCDVIFFTTLGAVSMILIHPGLALACLSTFIIFPPIVLRLAKLEYDAHEKAQAELTTLSEYVSQAVRGVRAQRASDSFKFWVECLRGSAGRYASLRLAAQKLAINSYPICSLPTIFSYMILFAWGPSLVVSGEISIGEFAALASYVYLLQGPVADVGELVGEWQRGFASVNRIAEISALAEKAYGQVSQLENVEDSSMPVLAVNRLQARRGDKTIFKEVTFNLYPGQWLGLCGDVGSGKSTLLQNLSGLVPVSSGTVRLKGAILSPERQRGVIAASKFDLTYAPEKPFVFAGTIRHNLVLNQKFNDEELWRVLELVCLADEVRQIPKGLDGIVGEGGVSLSGGQRQRLALARIVLRAKSLVILDDPLSAVDVETEAAIVKNLQTYWDSQAVVWSSNKLLTLKCCHEVARLTPWGLEFGNSRPTDRTEQVAEVLHV